MSSVRTHSVIHSRSNPTRERETHRLIGGYRSFFVIVVSTCFNGLHRLQRIICKSAPPILQHRPT